MTERGIEIDHSICAKLGSLFQPKTARALQPQEVPSLAKLNMVQTYEKVKGERMYLYCAVDCIGTVEFYFSTERD